MSTTARKAELLWHRAVFLLAFTSIVIGEERDFEVQSLDAALPVGLVEGGSSTFTNFPYVVSLRRRSDLGYFCAGVLIGTRHVLTAAHCLDFSIPSSDSLPRVVVGSASSTSTTGSGVEVLSTRKVVLHPGYLTQERSPDLAVLELSEEANQKPVRLLSFGVQKSSPVVALGWGAQAQGSGFSETLLEGSMELTSGPRCIRNNNKLCVRGTSSTCRGDDGGPIVRKGNTRADDVLIGIIGSEHLCGRPSHRPGVHTRAAPSIPWMLGTAGIRFGKAPGSPGK